MILQSIADCLTRQADAFHKLGRFVECERANRRTLEVLDEHAHHHRVASHKEALTNRALAGLTLV